VLTIDAAKRNHTAFAAWREACGLSIEQTCELLGKTRQMVVYLECGVTHDGRPVRPQLDTRKLMTAAAKGLVLEPWPLEK
jgi:transcriptional regulator with XRE-family HTH domain